MGLYVVFVFICCCVSQVISSDMIMAASDKRRLYDLDLTRARKLPNGLKLGVATAAYQIEGGADAGDKTESIWDTFCKDPRNIKDNSNASDTCKSYEYFKRDIEMIKYLGVSFYRFSISWPRIMPNGFANKISKFGYDYYNTLINELLANNIEPMITMYHWDLPQNLQDLGGWTNSEIVVWFEDYARVLYKLFGDRVKTWITLNEPKQFAVFGYGSKRFAPGINSPGIGDYMAVKNLLLAHARAWHLYNNEFRRTQNGICGITIATDYREGITDSPEDVETGNLVMDFEVGLYSHPIFTTKGGFPEQVIRRVAEKSAEQGFPRSRLPELTQEEIDYIKGTSDFYGFNLYSAKFCTTTGYETGMFPIPSYDDDIGVISTYLDFDKGAVIHCSVIPNSMRKSLNWVKDNCNNPPIMITENGFGTFGGLDDEDRICYLRKYINAMMDAIEEDRCNVTHYTLWTLMDNFEWDSGLKVKFGVFETDHEDDKKTRIARASAVWYRQLNARRILDPKFKTIREHRRF